jgi:hypothetical protein
MSQFLMGSVATASLIAGFFFLKFWRVSGDRLFAFFAAAFALLGVNWIVLGVGEVAVESRHIVYVIRLVAFLLIIAAVVDKNRRS